MNSIPTDRHIIWSDKNPSNKIEDERNKLDIQLSQSILVIGDLAFEGDRHTSSRVIMSGNIKDCLFPHMDINEWYVDMYGDLRAYSIHPIVGTNYYLYRVIKDGISDTQVKNLKDKIYEGKATRADITRITRRLGDEIAAVYGFHIPKQRVAKEQAR